MDAAEIEKWRQIDVGNYTGAVSVFWSYLEDINEKVQKGSRDFCSFRDLKDQSYEDIKRKFDSIDVEKVDPKLPRSVIAMLQRDIIPKLGKGFKELENIVDIYNQGGLLEILQFVIADKVEECKLYLSRMMKQAGRFRNWPGYEAYRAANPDKRKYLSESVA
ncbi:hypothetical protein GF371_04710 [Candidatus Woesearchaeota archaeon]|nr:hypothetical protein [Candidatus Woesearchaeota archaeon]